jgi:hypothetical protein
MCRDPVGRYLQTANHLDDLQLLTETYGASGHEEAVREQVKKLLPNWAKPETDGAGNLIFKNGKRENQFECAETRFHRASHMDEIGYQVVLSSLTGVCSWTCSAADTLNIFSAT